MLWWVFFVTIVIYIYMKLRSQHRYWKDVNVPYLKCLPIIGNMGPFVFRQKTQPEFVQDIYNSIKGRYIGVYLFGQATLVIKDLELIKQISIKDFDHFTDHRPFSPENDGSLFSKNLFSLTGQRWKSMRTTLSPAFTGSRMRTMFILINENAEQFTDYFSKQIKPNDTMTIQLKDTYTRFAIDIIATTAFGIKCNSLTEKDNEFYRMGKQLTSVSLINMLKFFINFMGPWLLRIFKIEFMDKTASDFFRNIVKNTVETREREGIFRPDMLQLLMEARKGKLKNEFSEKDEDSFAATEESNIGEEISSEKFDLTDDYLAAQVFLFFVAGLDSVSTMMGYVSYELALNIDVQQKLQIEIDTARKNCGGKFTYEIVLQMKYLDMVICEVLRKWPPGVVSDRMCTKPYTVQPETPDEVSVPIRKKDLIWIPAFSIHRDPQYYSDPEKFDPERFNDENKVNIKPFTYMPFGVGPRNCIASRFALMEIKTLMVHFLSKFTFVVVEETQIPVKLGKWYQNLQQEDGIRMGIKRRTLSNESNK